MQHQDVLDALAARLLDDETIEGEDLEQIFQGAGAAKHGVVRPLPGSRHRPSTPELSPLPRISARALASVDASGRTPPSMQYAAKAFFSALLAFVRRVDPRLRPA